VTVNLDASALLALLLDEPGAPVVRSALPGAEISTVNLSEVMAVVVERGGSAEDVLGFAAEQGLWIRAFADADAGAAAELRPSTRRAGLGLGDRACLALGRARGLPVLTADRVWAELDVGVAVRLVR
jgi:ribonuclease VapC